jgi:hypothetical protein
MSFCRWCPNRAQLVRLSPPCWLPWMSRPQTGRKGRRDRPGHPDWPRSLSVSKLDTIRAAQRHRKFPTTPPALPGSLVYHASFSVDHLSRPPLETAQPWGFHRKVYHVDHLTQPDGVKSDHLAFFPDPRCGAVFNGKRAQSDHLPLSCTVFVPRYQSRRDHPGWSRSAPACRVSWLSAAIAARPPAPTNGHTGGHRRSCPPCWLPWMSRHLTGRRGRRDRPGRPDRPRPCRVSWFRGHP